MKAPLVSVVLPVYNGASDVKRAIQTILLQTFCDYELIIINDGSTDCSAEVLESIGDSRIRLFHQNNMGLAATLNRGISLARGVYIARQDQDDLSHPQRLEKQIAYFDQHSECVLLGTAAEIWIGDEPTNRVHDHPTAHADLSFELLFNNPFVHSSVMMRRDVIYEMGGYTTDTKRQPPEDYELWSRMARRGFVANLPDRLLVYREVPQSMSRSGPNPFLDRLVTISAENLALANSLDEGNRDALDVAALTHSAFHRLSKRPNIKRMTALVHGAGRRLAQENSELSDRVAERIRNLEYQWVLHQTKAQWVRPIARKIRDCFNRVNLMKAR